MAPFIAGIIKFATSTIGGKVIDRVVTGGLINNKHKDENGFPVGKINWLRFGKQVILPVVIIIVSAIIYLKGGDPTAIIEAFSK